LEIPLFLQSRFFLHSSASSLQHLQEFMSLPTPEGNRTIHCGVFSNFLIILQDTSPVPLAFINVHLE
jgi:hypothetical protein